MRTVLAVTAREREVCGDDPGTLCLGVLRLTGRDFLASGADVLLARPLRIVVIIVLALVLRALARRAIRRLTGRMGEGTLPAALRPRGTRTASLFEATAELAERRRQRADTIGSVLRSLASFAILAIALAMVLSEIGLDLAPVLASAGIVGIAVGFGAQNLIKDFLTGLFMLSEDQYGVGDIVDLGPASGTIEAVGLRTTRLRDVDGVVWHIRNGEILRVGNKSQGWSRAVLDVPVAHSAPVSRVREVLKSVADGLWHDEDFADVVLEEPEVWGVEHLTADGVVVRLVVKTAPAEQWRVARELRERIKTAMEAEGLELPPSVRAVMVRDPA